MMTAALFDFGGTIDTNGVHWSERFWEYYRRFNIRVAKGDFENAFVAADVEILKNDLSHSTFEHILELQLSAQFDILNLQKERLVLQDIISECYRDTGVVIAAARNILEELKTKYKLALVSNFYGNLEIVCAEFGLDKTFDVKIDSEIVGIRKPDLRIFGIALERLSVKPEESYAIGDSYDRDIVPGKRLGCRTIWLKGKSWKEERRNESADFIIASFTELKTVLAR
ncbi:MAG: HAD family hydrolase [Bacteroidota bacterium]